MKELWERRRPRLELSLPELTALVQPFMPGGRVTAASRMVGGLANTLYKLDVSSVDHALVMRLYTRDHSACRKDVDIYDLVHSYIPIPELLYADTDGAAIGVPYVVTEFVDGAMLSHVLANSDHRTIGSVMAVVGQELAKIGTFCWAHSGFFGPNLQISHPITINGESHTAYIDECLFSKGAAQSLGHELAQQLSAFLHSHAHLLDELAGEAALVHADFNPYNILVKQRDDRWTVAAVLDWEFAFAGPPLFDIGNMLRNEHRLPPVFASRFIHGFEAAGGRLPPHWHKQIKLLDLLNLCDLLLHMQAAAVMTTDIVALIQRTINEWEP